MASRFFVVSGLTVVGLALVTGGCSSDSPARRFDEVRADPAPELEMQALSENERLARRALTYDENWRMLRDDWDRFWMVDRPSRLSRTRVPR